MVCRDNPLRLQISRLGSPSRNRHLQITLNNPTSITPLSPARISGRSVSSRGSNFDANIGLRWVSFQCKSTLLSPDADDHLVKAHEALARLTIKYKDEKYPCSREGLVRLGRAYKSGLTDDETAYREGVNQFKVDFDAFRV